MTASLTSFERSQDIKHNRRLKAEDKTHERLSRLESKAEAMIGELASGKFYFYPAGGKYREGSKIDLVAFIVRNGYAD